MDCFFLPFIHARRTEEEELQEHQKRKISFEMKDSLAREELSKRSLEPFSSCNQMLRLTDKIYSSKIAF